MTESQQPPTPEQPGQPPEPPPPPPPAAAGDIAPRAPEADYPSAYPLQFDVQYQERYSRLLPVIKWWLYTIPQHIVLFFVLIGAFFAIVIAWFAVLITGRYPRGLFDFVVGATRWAHRLFAYMYFLTDKYPPFSLKDDPSYPVRFNIDYPPDGRVARWRVIGNYILAIPHLIIVYFLGIALLVTWIVAGFAILFTGKHPRGIFNFMTNVMRWAARVSAYAYFMTQRYPPFVLG